MKILFIGDIVGRPGRRMVAQCLPRLREAHAIDFVLANAENAAGGMGATPAVLAELRRSGVHAFTMGNHVWREDSLVRALDKMPEVVRPANYPNGAPGRGAAVVELSDGRCVGMLSLLGRTYMEPLECPFRTADAELARLRKSASVVIVDMHAEATSEKVALGWYLDGRCTAVLGTHTHVQTADEWVLPEGTAYITDVGMCGPYHSVIGVQREKVIARFVTGIPARFNVAKGPCLFCAVLIEADDKSGKATAIHRILERDTEAR